MVITKPGDPRRTEIAEKIFTMMREGKSTNQACKEIGVDQSTFNLWMRDDEVMASNYARARTDLIDRIAAEIQEICDAPLPVNDRGMIDNAAVQKQKLQVDTRKWLLSKLAPKKYGEKLELTGDAENPISIQKIERVIISHGKKPDDIEN